MAPGISILEQTWTVAPWTAHGLLGKASNALENNNNEKDMGFGP